MDEELVGWSHPGSSGQCSHIPMYISDKWCLSGVSTGNRTDDAFITGNGSGIEHSLSKFAGYTKLSGAVATPEVWDAV